MVSTVLSIRFFVLPSDLPCQDNQALNKSAEVTRLFGRKLGSGEAKSVTRQGRWPTMPEKASGLLRLAKGRHTDISKELAQRHKREERRVTEKVSITTKLTTKSLRNEGRVKTH